MIAEIKELTISAPHAYIPPRPAVKSKQPHSMPSHNKTGCMAVRGGKEEPDGGIRRPACERGDVMGCLCLPSCPGEGNMLGRGTLCTLSLSPLWAWGADFSHPYTNGKVTYFSASCQIFLLYFVFWQGILTGLPVFLNLVYPISRTI